MSVVPRNRRRGRPINNKWLMNFAVVNGQYEIPGLPRRQAQHNLTNYQRTGSFTTITGWDGTSARVDTASRDSRLDGHVRDLYHQTDLGSAELISTSRAYAPEPDGRRGHRRRLARRGDLDVLLFGRPARLRELTGRAVHRAWWRRRERKRSRAWEWRYISIPRAENPRSPFPFYCCSGWAVATSAGSPFPNGLPNGPQRTSVNGRRTALGRRPCST